MRSLFSFGHRIGYAIYDVGAAISGPKVAGRLAERILPEEKLQRIIVLETDLRNHALLRLFYLSGGRVTEVADLHWPTYYGLTCELWPTGKPSFEKTLFAGIPAAAGYRRPS